MRGFRGFSKKAFRNLYQGYLRDRGFCEDEIKVKVEKALSEFYPDRGEKVEETGG